MTEQRWTGTQDPDAGDTGDAGGGTGAGEPPPGGTPPGGAPPGGTPPGAPPPGASGGAAVPPLRVLRRSRDDRVVAGLAGGLGRWARVDPVLFRVGFAVLTVFGGAGLLLYAIGWLLVPEQDAAESEGQRLTSGRSPGVVSVVLATVAGLILVGIVLDGNVGGVAALLVIGALVALAAARRDQGGTPPPYAQPPYAQPPQAPPPYPPQGYGPQGHGPQAPPPQPPPPSDPTVPYGTTASGSTPGTAAPAAPPGPPPASAPYGGGAYGPPPPAPAPWTAPPPPPEPRERSGLTALTLSLAALVTGVLLALDVADVADVPARVVVAAPLAVAALGLLVGTWFGRGRGLIGVGAVLTVVLAVTVATPDVPFEAGAGQRQWVPVVADDLADPYRLGAGEATLDLTRLEPAGRTLDVDARVGMGKLVVLVPEDVDLRADAEVTAGEIDMPDDVRTDGLNVERAYEEEAAVDPAEGTVDLDVRVGFGELEVRRAAS